MQVCTYTYSYIILCFEYRIYVLFPRILFKGVQRHCTMNRVKPVISYLTMKPNIRDGENVLIVFKYLARSLMYKGVGPAEVTPPPLPFYELIREYFI
jgi:hypothetical protein